MNNKSVKSIEEELLSKIEMDYLNNRQYIFISKDKYMEYINELLKKEFNNNITEFLNIVQDYTLTLIMNSSKSLNYIDSYINNNYCYTLNINEIIKYFKDLNNLFKYKKESIDINKLILLLKNNKLLYYLVEVIFKYYRTSFTNNRISDTLDCKILINLIDAYCVINNIEINVDNNLTYDEIDEVSYDINSLRSYLREIKKYKVLSRQEEKELIIKTKNGDLKSQDTMILCNLRLVASIVLKHYRNRELSELDLIQEGTIGVIKAIEKYDPKTNYKFSTYAYFWIKQQIELALLTKGRNIYIPVHMQEKMKNYKKKISDFENNFKRRPNFKEIMNITGYDEPTIALIQTYLNDTVSYDLKINEDEDNTILDMIPDKENYYDNIFADILKKEAIEKAMNNAKLIIREKDIIKRRYGFYGEIQTLEYISKDYSLTKERIRTIEKNALSKLKKYYRKDNVLSEEVDNNEFVRKSIIKTIYDYFNDYSFSQVDYAINYLSDECKDILTMKFGGDLKNPVKGRISSIQERKFYNKVLPRLTRILDMIYPKNTLNNESVSSNTCEILLTLFKINTFIELQHQISYDVLLVGLLESGYVDNIRYSDKVISEFLNKNIIDVYMLNLEFKKALYSNLLLRDILENRNNYLEIVKEKCIIK